MEKSIYAVNQAVSGTLCKMFDLSSGVQPAKKCVEHDYPNLDEFMVYIEVRGEIFECHIILGFPGELVSELLTRLRFIRDQEIDRDHLLNSLVAEIGNSVACQLADAEPLKNRIGRGRVGLPRIWGLGSDSLCLPLEKGDKGSLDLLDYQVDTFVSYKMINNRCDIHYNAMPLEKEA